ncbi:MAG: helix-turn-helix domain-containing protein [Thermodesulfobacteriota bacterium]|nr:helix-turn-helix domain-containing protein [Thermodesulfobacteriota bacterium]
MALWSGAPVSPKRASQSRHRSRSSLLGTTPETLSRSLGRVSKQNLIEVKGRWIRLLDRSQKII